MAELRSCPFCGREPDVPEKSVDGYWVECSNPNCMALIESDTKEEAIKAWNTRTDWWIPVSERLPEDDSLTLIYDEVSQRTYLGRLEWGDWFYNGVKCYPTHWSPIPAPPEER